MDYYFKEVLPRMSAGRFLSFEDCKFGAGVFGEAEFLANLNKPIWEITPEGKISSLSLDNSRMLSIEEIRERTNKN